MRWIQCPTRRPSLRLAATSSCFALPYSATATGDCGRFGVLRPYPFLVPLAARLMSPPRSFDIFSNSVCCARQLCPHTLPAKARRAISGVVKRDGLLPHTRTLTALPLSRPSVPSRRRKTDLIMTGSLSFLRDY